MELPKRLKEALQIKKAVQKGQRNFRKIARDLDIELINVQTWLGRNMDMNLTQLIRTPRGEIIAIWKKMQQEKMDGRKNPEIIQKIFRVIFIKDKYNLVSYTQAAAQCEISYEQIRCYMNNHGMSFKKFRNDPRFLDYVHNGARNPVKRNGLMPCMQEIKRCYHSRCYLHEKCSAYSGK